MVGTKYSLSVRDRDLNAGGNHRKSLVAALEASLRRLRTGYVDILWRHAWDYLTPPEEVMRALDDQVRLGKPLYSGISDTPVRLGGQQDITLRSRHRYLPASRPSPAAATLGCSVVDGRWPAFGRGSS